MPCQDSQRGFTLVELMVVLVIIGLAASAVVLSMPEEGGSVVAEAERFAARAKAARDAAIVEARPVMLRLDDGGYVFAQRGNGAWQVRSRYAWAPATEVAMVGTAGSRTRFDSTGLAEPLRVTLKRHRREAAVEIAADGRIHVRP